MSKKASTQKSKKSNKKFSKKNIGFILFYLKVLKIFKIFLAIILVSLTAYFIFVMYKNNIVDKTIEMLSLEYSKFIYKDICNNIEINGINKANVEKIDNEIYNFCNLENKNDLMPLLNRIMTDPWIKNINIRRELPNTLHINIEEYLPFAMWKNGNDLHIIDENGKIIMIDEREKRGYFNLIIVAGDGAKENIYSLFNLLSSNPSLFSRIKSALRIGERRWNLELDNGIIVKMPEKDELDAWGKLNKILSIRGSEIGLKTIDLRNKDKIFLEEE